MTPEEAIAAINHVIFGHEGDDLQQRLIYLLTLQNKYPDTLHTSMSTEVLDKLKALVELQPIRH